MLQRIKKLLEHNALILAIIASIIIAFLSLSSIPKIDLGIKIKSGDKYLHALAYFTLSVVWYFALNKKIKKNSFKFYVILLLIAYGIILEALQGGLTNYRTADFFDVMANTFGIILATLFFDKIMKWYHRI
ncbi:MAG: VanZ family protein [Flavobacteriaceae bacterium]|nr:VanZ family protein [Flavobacteriaceae bacterium]